MIPVLVLFTWCSAGIAACWPIKITWFNLGGSPEYSVIVNMAEENIDAPRNGFLLKCPGFLVQNNLFIALKSSKVTFLYSFNI